MPSIHVCPLHLVASEAQRLQPSGLVTLLSPFGAMPERPPHLALDDHLIRQFHDIDAPMDDLIPPSKDDVAAVIDFARRWDRKAPLLIHCFAGVSRSTAAAFITSCALHPHLDEDDIADRLRAASPTATPNRRMVAMADLMLGRGGRMRDAITLIGQGEFTAAGRPFELLIT